MKIAISNIAWNKGEDKEILKLLKKYSFSAIEIAPTMIWKEPIKESVDSIKAYKRFWNKEGIEIVSIQSVLFGHPELTIFENAEKRKKTLLYIKKIIYLCSLLGVEDIIFGSPANRNSGNLSFEEKMNIASDFFYSVGEMAEKYGIYFCMEPIPKVYGTNFINNTKEGILLIKKVNHLHFRLHLDSGALTINQENYVTAIENAFPYLKHFHISERALKPIGTTDVDHKTISKVLNKLQFDQWLSIEMRRNEMNTNSQTINETLKFVADVYK